MTVDFRRALARLVPVFMPDLLFRLGRDGQPVFKEFAAAIVPTEFHAGQGLRLRHHAADRLLRRAGRRADRAAANLDLATVQQQELAMTFRFHISQYLSRRAADWKEKGFTETLADWPRSTRARSSGATTSAPPSRTGRRSPTRAIRSADARASTSASCCASCCAAPT
jgi:amidase